MLQNLGYDVLVGHVFPNLDGNDIVNVSMCCKSLKQAVTQLVWRSQYRSTFDMASTNNNVEGNWEEAYAKRLNCDIYCWGGNLQPASFDGVVRSSNRRGFCLPWRIDTKIKTRQIELCGYGLLMLALDGSLWLYGDLRQPVYRSPMPEFLRSPRCVPAQFEKGIGFISAGRNYAIGIIGTQMYTLNQHLQWAQVPVGDIMTVSAGWDVSAAIRHDHGVILWKDLISAPETYTSVPDTKGPGALAAGAGFVLFSDANSRLHFIDTSDDVPKKKFILEDETPVCIRANYRRFGVICASGRTYVGEFVDESLAIGLVPDSEEIDFTDLALGDYHFLGLSKAGQVYAWGREPGKCGSLGLGLAQDVIETSPSFEQGCDIVVKSPRRVDLKGAISINAGGWQSAAIVVTEGKEGKPDRSRASTREEQTE